MIGNEKKLPPRLPYGRAIERSDVADIQRHYKPLPGSTVRQRVDRAMLLYDERDAAMSEYTAAEATADELAEQQQRQPINERLQANDRLAAAVARVDRADRELLKTLLPLNDELDRIDALRGRLENGRDRHTANEQRAMMEALNELQGDRQAYNEATRPKTRHDVIIDAVLAERGA